MATLLRLHGVREGDTVTVTLPKGADQITAVLGVLAAGCRVRTRGGGTARGAACPDPHGQPARPPC